MVGMTNLFAIPDILKQKWEGAKFVEYPITTELQEKSREAEFQSAAGKGELVDNLTLFTLPKL